MRISVGLFPYDRWGGVDAIVEAAQAADRLGYYAVGLPEHLVMPARDGVDPVSAVWYDDFVLGATLAAHTSRVRLLFNAGVVPYRHPVELAKLLATLDVVSKGRVTYIVGTGWMRREFRLLDVPFDDRGARTDDALRAMRTMWTQPTPSYEGSHFSIPPVHFLPTCVQQPHVPLWIGGNGPRPIRRAVELGDGWIPFGIGFEEILALLPSLRQRLTDAGRDPDNFVYGAPLQFGPPDEVLAAAESHASRRRDEQPSAAPSGPSDAEIHDTLGAYREAGINHVLLQFAWRDGAEYIDALERFAEVVNLAGLGAGT